ncbi:hypothetical protein SNE40_013798 [Patella caerulea]
MMETFFGLQFTCTFPPTTCSNRCLGRDSSIDDIGSPCMCDPLCVVFGDCCPDYYTLCNIFPNNEVMLNFIKSNGRTKLTEQEMDRIEAFADSSSCNKVLIGTYETYIRSIATCNKDYPEGDIKDKCEGRQSAFPLDIPLSVLSTPFMTYRNVYCAVCNLDLNYGIKYWSANIKCQVDKAVTLRTIEELQLYPDERCETILTKPTDIQVRLCDGHLDYQSCSSSLGGDKKREAVDNTGPVLSPPLDISVREVRSVPDSDFNVKKGNLNTSGHDIRKRNAGDNQGLNNTNVNGKSEGKQQNVTSINEFEDLDTDKQFFFNNTANPANHDSTSTPLTLFNTTSLPTEHVTIMEKIKIPASVQPDPIRMPLNVEPDNITSTDSSPNPIIPPAQQEMKIEASENVNDDFIENNLPLLCDAYYSQYNRDGLRYKNPHCYACHHGWDVFKGSNTTSKRKAIACQFSTFFGRVSSWPNIKVVNHYFGVYGNSFSFYSSDLGRVFDEVPSSCGIAAVYDMISQSCKNTKCMRGSVPYYETCINTTLYSLYSSNINDSTTLYVKINGTTTGIYDKYLELVQNVIDDLESMDLNQMGLDQSSGMIAVNRSIKLISLDRVRQGYTTEQKTESGEILFQQALTHLRLKLAVPILFNDTSKTLHDLMYGNNSNYRFSIEDMIIQNYEFDTTHSCTVGIPNTHTNLPMISIGRHVFVEIKESLVDISKARFTIRKNTNNSWKVASITYCDRGYPNGNSVNSIVNIRPKASLMCVNTLTLSRAMFDELGERVMLKTGELIAPSDFVRNGEELVVCRESLLLEQSLIQDRTSQILFKNTLTIIAIILKLLTFLVSICRKYSVQGGTYFYILALTTSLIDVVHLLENLTNVNTPTILPIMLHFSWLFALYNSMAWCINMIGSNSKRSTSCCCRHLVISAAVSIATVVICATGDVNDPPWDVGYGSNNHIFSAKSNVVLYGYVLPASAAVVITALCHIYRIVRRKMYEKDKIFYSCNILVSGLLVVQFTFACLEGLGDSTVFYYLYFTSSIVVSWTFLAIFVLIWMKKPTRLSSSLKYIKTTTTKPENIYETTD